MLPKKLLTNIELKDIPGINREEIILLHDNYNIIKQINPRLPLDAS